MISYSPLMRKSASTPPARPLRLLQPVLRRAILQAARKEPAIFERLGEHSRKRFLINPVNLPFAFLLQPDGAFPRLSAFRKSGLPAHDAAISGAFLTLVGMIEGNLDGDALFFSRDLSVTGDVEAVVALRNALDDAGGDMIDALLPFFAKPFIRAFRHVRKEKTA